MNNLQKRRFPMGGVAVLLVAAALGGCAAAVVGGAVVGGMVATDRRTTGAQVDDEGIELRAVNDLSNLIGERAHINVTAYNGQVLLTGEVPTAQDRQLAEKTVARLQNVRSIVNELAVMSNSSLTQRSTDSLTTGQVKASLLDTSDLFANAFKVLTERGTVYLMGRVTQREADRATEIARGVSGVQKVVRVLQIISEAELQKQPAPPPAPAQPAPASPTAPKT